jgi:hypothetical protein
VRWLKHSPSCGGVNLSFLRRPGAAHAAENGEGVAGHGLPDELAAGLDRAVQTGRQGLRVGLRSGADDQVAPLPDRLVALALELLGELAGLAARPGVDPNLPRRVALVELLLLPGLGRRLVVPALLLLEPALDPRVTADDPGGAPGLGVRVRVDEDVVAVVRDREAAARVARAAEPLEERVRVIGADMDPEVVYAGILPEIPSCSRCLVIPPRKNG